MVTLDQAGRARGRQRILRPPRPLRELVEHAFIDAPGRGGRDSAQRSWRIVPDPAAHLIFSVNRRGTRSVPRLRLVGPRSVHADARGRERVLTVGVRFRPGVLPLLVGSSARALADASFELDELFALQGRQLQDEVLEAEDPHTILGLILDFIGRVAAGQAPDWKAGRAVAALGAAAGQSPVAEAAGATGMAVRTLRQASSELVGLSPMRVARILRLHGTLRVAVRGAARGRPLVWSRIAHRLGYADQPHLIREFQALLGETPTKFLARGRPRGPGTRGADLFNAPKRVSD